MNNFFIFSILSLVSGIVFADEPMRIHDKGLDGNDRIFVVNCPNGDRSSVTVTYEYEPTVKVTKVCVFPAQGEKSCRNKMWDVDEAAEFSCK